MAGGRYGMDSAIVEVSLESRCDLTTTVNLQKALHGMVAFVLVGIALESRCDAIATVSLQEALHGLMIL